MDRQESLPSTPASIERMAKTSKGQFMRKEGNQVRRVRRRASKQKKKEAEKKQKLEKEQADFASWIKSG